MKLWMVLAVVLIVPVGLCYSQQWTESVLAGLEVKKISDDSQYYKKIVAKLGDIYVAYKYSGLTFRDDLGSYINVLDVVYVFAAKGTSVTVLGRVDKNSITDAFGKNLYDLAKSDPIFFPHVVGVSSSMLRTFTAPTLVGLNELKRHDYYETEPILYLTIDIDKKTIVMYDSGGK